MSSLASRAGLVESGSAVCNFFAKGLCDKGKLCPFRHNQGEKMVVCKHWLRGLCKKGDQCGFLHQYDVTRMPECYFYSKFGDCNKKECSFLHVKPAFQTRDCPWYDQGFCKDGPLCKHRHVPKTMCVNYLVGFCPKGPHCQFAHPKMNLSLNSSYTKGPASGPSAPGKAGAGSRGRPLLPLSGISAGRWEAASIPDCWPVPKPMCHRQQEACFENYSCHQRRLETWFPLKELARASASGLKPPCLRRVDVYSVFS
ncbi:putative cleavage and polyadenylation specificity factor subunit 4-like protein isoform X1 [Mustela erminea]|uniref:putative cleavage and polyadenylation specificity factor subunit 4-like protein isoform X1 n=1 Tax=Mustela erminea TaxID=36723 RepID=UPI001386C926|nr:putative cleavage and polyadenylation specificity factor subunit 4-like protein isoform X1 [Mustela erminea]